MAFILRWPAILVLFALVALCAFTALGAAGVIAGAEAPVVGQAEIDQQAARTLEAARNSGAASAGWIVVGLLGGAAVFFLISAIRLIRRTQGFWTWLLGFACFGGQWAYQQYASGEDIVELITGIDWRAYMDYQALLADLGSPQAQIGLLAIVLVVGLFVFIVDAVDRAHWDRQTA